MNNADMKKGILCIAVTTFFFSLMEIVLKSMSGVFNPLQMNATRFLVGGLVCLPFMVRHLKKNGLKFERSDLTWFLLTGLMFIVFSMNMYQLSIQYIDASVVAILFSSNPIFIMFIAYALIHEPLYKRNIISLVLDVIGILFVINILHISLNPVGVILCLISTVLFAFYAVLGKKPTSKFGGLTNTCMSFLFGACEMIVLLALTHIPAVSSWLTSVGLDTFASVPFFQGYSLKVLPAWFFVCAGVTGLGFICYFKAMEYVSVNTVSMVFFFKPVLAPIFAYFLISEPLPGHKIIGILFILAASLTNILPPILAQHREDHEKIRDNIREEMEEDLYEDEEIYGKIDQDIEARHARHEERRGVREKQREELRQVRERQTQEREEVRSRQQKQLREEKEERREGRREARDAEKAAKARKSQTRSDQE